MTKLLNTLFLILTIHVYGFQKVIYIPFGETKLDVSWVNSPIKSVSCGKFHAYFQTKDNTVFGIGDRHALGLQLPRIDLQINKFSTGDIHSLFLDENNSLVQFFSVPILDMYYPKNLVGVREMGSAPKMSYALSHKNILYTWGAGKVIAENAIYPRTYGVKTASLGENHVAFINIKDRVFVWGSDALGQKKIPSFYDTPEAIVSGDNHVLVKDMSGNIYAWGDNTLGQCNLPDSLKGGVTKIYAKGNVSAALVGDSLLYVWGENVSQTINLNDLGKLQTLGLGNDYLILVLDQKPEMKYEEKLYTKEFFGIEPSETRPKKDQAKAFFETLAKENFGKNNFSVTATDSEWNGDFGTEVTFEGTGNTVTIKNSGMTFNLDGSTQKIIFKGSNKNVVINQSNKVINANGSEETIVIDLNKINENPEYSSLYEQDSEKLEETSGETTAWKPDLDENNDPNRFYDPYGHIGYFTLLDYPLFGDAYLIYSTGIDLPANDYAKLQAEINQMTDAYEMAQIYAYVGNNTAAVNELIEGVNSDFQICQSCYSQLYYVYKDGLLDQAVDKEKANYILSLYCKNFECYSTTFVDEEEAPQSGSGGGTFIMER